MNESMIKTMPVIEGMKLVNQMLKAGYVAKMAGKCQNIISIGISHSMRNGKPYWFTEDDRIKFQDAVRRIASEMLLQRMVAEPTTVDDDPWCGGNGWVEKFHTLRKRVSMKYLFEQAGYSEIWYANRINKKSAVTGRFSDEDIERINRALHNIALQLSALEFVPDNRDE